MHALNGGYRKGGFGAVMGFVLRHVRRYVRSTVFFLSRDLRVPRYAGLYGCVGFFAAVGAYGMVVGGHTPQAMQTTMSVLGFAVEDVSVSGTHYMSEIDVMSALGLDGNTSTIVFDADEARRALATLPWVQAADVQKIYPGRIMVSIVERTPFALWQHDGQIDVVDVDGRVIVPFVPGTIIGLPQIVGVGAQRHATEIMAQVMQYPEISSRVTAYVRVGDRRWDLMLNNGMRIMLPEFGADKQLAEIVKADQAEGLFNRAVSSVDLRLEDRITLALPAEALGRYQQSVKETERRQKAMKGGRV